MNRREFMKNAPSGRRMHKPSYERRFGRVMLPDIIKSAMCTDDEAIVYTDYYEHILIWDTTNARETTTN